MDIIPEVRISIELGITPVDCSPPVLVAAKDVNETVLNLLGTFSKVHKLHISAPHHCQSSENSRLHYLLDTRPGEYPRSTDGTVANWTVVLVCCGEGL